MEKKPNKQLCNVLVQLEFLLNNITFQTFQQFMLNRYLRMEKGYDISYQVA